MNYLRELIHRFLFGFFILKRKILFWKMGGRPGKYTVVYNTGDMIRSRVNGLGPWYSNSKQNVIYIIEELDFVYWYENEYISRQDGPAIMSCTYDCYKVKGETHRIDGFAYYNFYNKLGKYHINGDILSEEEFNCHPLVIKNKLERDIKNLLSNHLME